MPDLAQMMCANDELNLVQRTPNAATVESWINEAKTLEPAMSFTPNIEDDSHHFVVQTAGGLY